MINFFTSMTSLCLKIKYPSENIDEYIVTWNSASNNKLVVLFLAQGEGSSMIGYAAKDINPIKLGKGESGTLYKYHEVDQSDFLKTKLFK